MTYWRKGSVFNLPCLFSLIILKRNIDFIGYSFVVLPVNVLEALGHILERLAHMIAQRGLEQRQAQVPLRETAELDETRVLTARGVLEHFVALVDGVDALSHHALRVALLLVSQLLHVLLALD